MDSLVIRSASGPGSLEFLERTPAATSLPIERYKVKLTDQDLVAIGRVYYVHADTNPAPLFAQMAANWKGWQGAFAWESLEGELSLRCSQDRAGHVLIRVELRSGGTAGDWMVQATVMTEAGQLEALAEGVQRFFTGSG
jgi:uncharacterized protein (DUF2249 family)